MTDDLKPWLIASASINILLSTVILILVFLVCCLKRRCDRYRSSKHNANQMMTCVQYKSTSKNHHHEATLQMNKEERPLPLTPRSSKLTSKNQSQYDTIIDAVAKTLTDLHQRTLNGEANKYEDICSVFCQEIAKTMKSRDATFHTSSTRRKLDMRYSLHEQLYEEVSANKSLVTRDELYASCRSTPNLRKVKKTNSFGTRDHLKYLREMVRRSDKSEIASYMEPKCYAPRAHCPANLRDLCQRANSRNTKDADRQKLIKQRTVEFSEYPNNEQHATCVTPTTSTDSEISTNNMMMSFCARDPSVHAKRSKNRHLSNSLDSVF